MGKAEGKLAVLLPGLGAVATTFIAGVEACKRGFALPIGSLTQMQRIRLGSRSDGRSPLIRELLPLASLQELEFGAWDPIPDNAAVSAIKAGVLRTEDLRPVLEPLEWVRPMPAVFDERWVPNLENTTNVKERRSLRSLIQHLQQDALGFMFNQGCNRAVMIWCASTERYEPRGEWGDSVEALERAIDNNEPGIPPSVLYAYAAITSNIPFACGAPNHGCDSPAMEELAEMHGVPIAGKDLLTGQTAMKCAIAPMLKAKMLGLEGWFSSNILGNRDGAVLEDPQAFRSKEMSKLGVLDTILQPDLYPDLYGETEHQVRINYYKPRGDAKEGWDAVDIFGWMGYKMAIKVNFLCRDSILAAPLVLDLALLVDLAARFGRTGVQEALSFFFKDPQVPEGVPYAEHDIHIRHWMLKNWLRELAGEERLTHVEEAEGERLETAEAV